MKTVTGSHSGASVTILFIVVALAVGCASYSGYQNKFREATEFSNSAGSLYKEGRYQESIVQLTMAIERYASATTECRFAMDCSLDDATVAKNRAQFYTKRALAYMGDNQIEQALKDARTAIRYEEKYPLAHGALIWALLLAGDKAAAQEELKVLKKLDEKKASEYDVFVNSANGVQKIKVYFLSKTPFGKGVAAYDAKDYEKALTFLRPLAEQGDARAQYYLGVMYQKGYGVVRSDAEALKWYVKAADQKENEAFVALGDLYCEGQLPSGKDLIKAYMWFTLYLNIYINPEKISDAEHSITPLTPLYVADRLEQLEKDMTKEELAEAIRRVNEWMNKHRKK